MKIPIISSIILLRNILALVFAYRKVKDLASPGGKKITKEEREIIRDKAEDTLESIITLIKR